MSAASASLRAILLSLWLLVPASLGHAQEAITPVTEQDRRSTAVALNYCRAAFHHIRKDPSKAVLLQEQEQILNNLNLDGISDPELIRLYTAVLDEISQIGIADRERQLLREDYRRNVTQKTTWDVVAFGTQLATAQVASAVKTGANSWWDYRNTTTQRDRDLLKVDRTQMTAVVEKSSLFLDTFWKLAQRNEIPDRWLVRSADLDKLEQAMSEPNPEVRLRVLRRMEPFMEAYPPYWYYVARTQQSLGDLTAAVDTYVRLAELGHGHFRRDDMLATGLANRAALEDVLGRDMAVATAEQALHYSSDVWEANLLCARVLERHQQLAAAEDAILRNLDVGLEQRLSQVFRVSLYYHSGQKDKLAAVLADPQNVAELPMSALVRCAALLGSEQTPNAVAQLVAGSIEGQVRSNFGPDDFVLAASPAWQLHLAKATLVADGQEIAQPDVHFTQRAHLLRFPAPRDWGNPLRSGKAQEVALRLTYPDETTIRVSFGASTYAATSEPLTPLVGTSQSMRLASIEVDDTHLAIHSAAYGPRFEAVPVSTTTEPEEPAEGT
jgi:hypothetical protein